MSLEHKLHLAFVRRDNSQLHRFKAQLQFNSNDCQDRYQVDIYTDRTYSSSDCRHQIMSDYWLQSLTCYQSQCVFWINFTIYFIRLRLISRLCSQPYHYVIFNISVMSLHKFTAQTFSRLSALNGFSYQFSRRQQTKLTIITCVGVLLRTV